MSKMRSFITRAVFSVIALMVILTTTFVIFTNIMFSGDKVVTISSKEIFTVEEDLDFPVGVNFATKIINEDPLLDWYVSQHLSINTNDSKRDRFINKLLAEVSKLGWYQNLASSVSRILVIYSGERKEEIVANFASILRWSDADKELFLEYVSQAEPALSEGKFYPGRYVVPLDASPELVADLVYTNFNNEILSRYSNVVEASVPLADALIIASLLEREAYDFTDMRIISGVIWNRLFINMPLQLDASLQYARGSNTSEKLWWPVPLPRDKFIDSPFNTYQNKGLPPYPIANPSVESVIAALNPRITECMFYFHGPKGAFYCTNTYEDHVAKLKEIYGQGI
jgi:UPF0755 protein